MSLHFIERLCGRCFFIAFEGQFGVTKVVEVCHILPYCIIVRIHSFLLHWDCCAILFGLVLEDQPCEIVEPFSLFFGFVLACGISPDYGYVAL